MLNAGYKYELELVKFVDFGAYLNADGDEILLPKRFIPREAAIGDRIPVFLYHDGEGRIIATTQEPKAVVGEIVMLECVDTTKMGAFLSFGIMKDLFVPVSQQADRMEVGEEYLVQVYLDEQTGRIAGTEKFRDLLQNEEVALKEGDEVGFTVWQKTDIGYKCIINHRHIGVVHFADTIRDLEYGEVLRGFVKKITEDHKIDLVPGKKGYQKVENEAGKILNALLDAGGFLPYNDKTEPEKIYEVFDMSKKTFKMTIGKLYKERKIEITKAG